MWGGNKHETGRVRVSPDGLGILTGKGYLNITANKPDRSCRDRKRSGKFGIGSGHRDEWLSDDEADGYAGKNFTDFVSGTLTQDVPQKIQPKKRIADRVGLLCGGNLFKDSTIQN